MFTTSGNQRMTDYRRCGWAGRERWVYWCIFPCYGDFCFPAQSVCRNADTKDRNFHVAGARGVRTNEVRWGGTSELGQMRRVRRCGFNPVSRCSFMPATGQKVLPAVTLLLPLLPEGTRVRNSQTAGARGSQCGRKGGGAEDRMPGSQVRPRGLSFHFLTVLETLRMPTMLGLQRPPHT